MRTDHKLIRLGAIVAATLVVGTAHAGIANTKHNLSATGPAGRNIVTDNPEICVFCHTPHAAIKNANIPLWNHTISSEVDYTVYASPTLNAADVTDLADDNSEANAAVSNLCMSCHDGTVAVMALNNPSNQHLVTTVTTGPADGKITGAPNLGTDLANDHPVNFTYDAALQAADGGLNDPATLVDVRLYNGKVQCASCHDPHYDYSVDTTRTPFLRSSMTGSGLCLKCHAK